MHLWCRALEQYRQSIHRHKVYELRLISLRLGGLPVLKRDRLYSLARSHARRRRSATFGTLILSNAEYRDARSMCIDRSVSQQHWRDTCERLPQTAFVIPAGSDEWVRSCALARLCCTNLPEVGLLLTPD